MLPGAKVRAEFSSPLGEPVAYLIRGALIALRDDQAEKIFIRKSEVRTPNSGGNNESATNIYESQQIS